ncbi:HXXXD-type acyl-transferase family protein [Medicago truncatula]|uniref:HXXXD-type acyl-transferase family protein n=1 Tax=Medicago truncatula TaxID=3880 RepID=G7J6X5_MEDTR|nr:HXXXD-type acyl-transferase family protein [Medicago truncatula]
MSIPSLNIVSSCFIKPYPTIKDSNQICYLTHWDIAMLSTHYNQKGLIFKKPTSSSLNQQHFIENLVEKLKHSLSLTLFHFYPLSGRLVTKKSEDPDSYTVFVDCKNSPGAKFIHATLDITINDILTPIDVPPIVHSFFDHDKAVNHDGHTMSLLSIQVTELVDGVFIGCSMNHCLCDGTAYWNFFNTFSEIFQNDRWFPQGYGPIINLPFKHHHEFVHRYETPILRERIFHFSVESIAKLKAKANAESNTNKISSFQSLSALVWRSITHARQLQHGQRTTCKMATNNRTRMEPPLPKEYFGNSLYVVSAETTVGELLENDLGWAAWKIHVAIANHDDKVVRRSVEKWFRSPFLYRMDLFFDPYTVMISGSPRFNTYGNEFGMGKALAVRSGYANKFDGKVISYPGQEGGGSIDLEVCLSPKKMMVLETNEEFMNSVCV